MTLEEILATSAESELLSCRVIDHVIILSIYHDELERVIEFKLPYISFYSTFSEHSTPAVCFMKIEKISAVLNIEHGVYVAAHSFPDFMYEIKQGLHIAYGLRSSQFQYMLRFIGVFKLNIPLRGLEDCHYSLS